MPNQLKFTQIKLFVCLFLVLFLAACGSGGKVTDPPAAPEPRISAKSEKVNIEWDAVPDAYFYKVYWGDKAGVNNQSINSIRVDDVTVEINGLINDQAYFFVVTAVGEGNESGLSAELTATPIAIPVTPAELQAEPADKQIQLSWQAVDKATEYHIFIAEANADAESVTPQVATTPSLLIENLENGKAYSIWMSAINPSGESPVSAKINVTPTTTLKLASGQNHSCVVKSDHSLWCWGDNTKSQLGIGNSDQQSLPVRVGVDNDWADIALGLNHSCASKRDGSLWCWGDNFNAQLAINIEIVDQPTKVDLDQPVETLGIAAPAQTSCVIDTLDALYCWGSNVFGQTGSGSTEISVPPSIVAEAEKWKIVSVSAFHACAIKIDNSLWCWGANFFGELGVGSNTGSLTPIVVGQTKWTDVVAGSVSSCAIDESNKLWCWGNNASGQLGDGSEDTHGEPNVIASDVLWSSVSVGGVFACAIDTLNNIWCWGDNSVGQLGVGSTDKSNIPVKLDVGTEWVKLSAGDAHVCAVKSNGDVYCWGDGQYGQLGVGSVIDLNAGSENPTEYLVNPAPITFP